MSLQPAFHVRSLWKARVSASILLRNRMEQAQAANNVKVCFDNLALPTTAWDLLTRLHL